MSIDTTPPVAPSIALLQDSGSSNSDRITNNKAITGSTEAGALVVLYEGSTALASATAASDGSWTIASGVADGAHTLRAVASDAAGNSAASVDLVATFDTVAPDAQLGLTNATDTGTKGDGITATSKPILTGTAESNASIILYKNGVTFGSNPFSADAWSRGTNLASGSATFSVAVSDVAGNSTSRTLLVSIDTTPPAAPGGVLQAGSDSGTLGDRITRYTTQAFGGSTDPGAVVSVVEAGTTLGVATAAADGSWSVTLSLASGVHSLASRATDAAGNVSAVSNQTLTIDTLPPQVPSIDLDTASDGIVAHDGLTNSAAPVLQGTTDAGAVVVLQEGTTQLGSAVANTAGLWSFTSSLSHGTHQLTATAVDGEGNSSAATGFSLTVDTVAPDAPGIGLDPDDDPGIRGDGITSSTYPVLSGTAEAGSTVFLYENGQQFGQAVASTAGTWAVNSAFLSGAHTVTAVAVDAAGNSSAAGGFTLSIDTTPPAAPSVGLTAATDGGAKGDGLTIGGRHAGVDAGSGDDVITVTTVGDHSIDGGSGDDSVTYNFHAVDAVLERAPDGSIHLTRGGHTDILQNIESIHFLDGAYQPRAAVTGDSDHDFHAEIALQRGTAGLVQLGWLNANALGSQELQDSAPGSLIGHADFDGDGKSDLLFRAANGDLSIWTMDGTTHAGTIAGFGTLGAALQLRGIGDTNGDGFNDLVLRDTDSGKISVWTQQGGSVTGQWELGTVDTAWDIKAVGDFNGDGQADIMFQHASTDYLWLWELGGPGQPQILTNGSRGLGGPTHDWQLQDSGDFDGDGRTDLLWQNSTTNELYIWAMEGNAIKRNLSAPGHEDLDIGLQGHVGFAAVGQQVAGVAEMTGDGRYDIVLRAADGALSIWQMNGLTVLQQFNNIANPGSDWHLV